MSHHLSTQVRRIPLFAYILGVLLITLLLGLSLLLSTGFSVAIRLGSSVILDPNGVASSGILNPNGLAEGYGV